MCVCVCCFVFATLISYRHISVRIKLYFMEKAQHHILLCSSYSLLKIRKFIEAHAEMTSAHVHTYSQWFVIHLHARLFFCWLFVFHVFIYIFFYCPSLTWMLLLVLLLLLLLNSFFVFILASSLQHKSWAVLKHQANRDSDIISQNHLSATNNTHRGQQ